jgi:hypothetical protein
VTHAAINLFDTTDTPWIGELLDVVEHAVGQPWRVALERIEHAPLEAHPSRVAIVVRALRKLTATGKLQRTRIARRARAIVLGHPALDPDARQARLAAAGCILDLDAATVESLLWADLALERPVVLPDGRPHEAALVAAANLDRLQRAVRRARELRLRVRDRANELVRVAARTGLIAKVSRGGSGETVLDLAGPLSLFHATTVYGRALAQLVPLLADHEAFTLELVCDYDGRERRYHVEPPIALPPVRAGRRKPSIAERLGDELAGAGLVVRREPPPIAYGDTLVFPDLVVDPGGEPHWIEVVGFSTAEYLAHKLASYGEAGIERVMLCVDEERAAEIPGDPRVLPYRRQVDAQLVITRLRA